MFWEFFIIKRRILSLLKNRFSKTETILDIGCGEKPYYHNAINSKIICADILQTKKAHIECDASTLPLKKSKFHGVVCINSLYYFNNPFEVIKEFSNVLKKNGKLILITPFIYPIHDAPYDKYRFTEFGLKELLKNYFEIKEIKTIGSIFNLPAVFFHSLIKGLPLMTPRSLRIIARVLSIVLIPFYAIAQIISLLDFIDRSRRWPSYYFVLATKK